VGWRSTFYRAATIVGSGLLVMLAGVLENRNVALDPERFRQDSPVQFVAGGGQHPVGLVHDSYTVAGLFLMFQLLAQLGLPPPPAGRRAGGRRWAFGGGVLCHVRGVLPKARSPDGSQLHPCYRFDEAQLGKVISPFPAGWPPQGRVGIDTSQVGLAYGTFGIAALTCGVWLGRLFTAAKYGLKNNASNHGCTMYLPKAGLSSSCPTANRKLSGGLRQRGGGAIWILASASPPLCLTCSILPTGRAKTAHYAHLHRLHGLGHDEFPASGAAGWPTGSATAAFLFGLFALPCPA